VAISGSLWSADLNRVETFSPGQSMFGSAIVSPDDPAVEVAQHTLVLRHLALFSASATEPDL
jgi:hypothetical protein